MTTRAYNPFASNELRYPESQREYYRRFCSPGGANRRTTDSHSLVWLICGLQACALLPAVI